MISILLTCVNNLDEHIISLREEVWTNKIDHFLLKAMYQAKKVSGIVYMI